MKPIALKKKYCLVAVIAGTLMAAPAMAEKPSWAGAGKGGKEDRVDRRDEQKAERREDQGRERRDEVRSQPGRGGASTERRHFEERQQVVVRNYYATQFRSGRCPPGLAKKHNGCMPPGQAKKWDVGRPLPRDVVYYPVPQDLVVQIGPPPSGYRYVRVASDILMLAIGTGIVIDAIQNLSQ